MSNAYVGDRGLVKMILPGIRLQAAMNKMPPVQDDEEGSPTERVVPFAKGST